MNNALDRIDLKILQTLQADGRITNKDLAERVNLSPSACHQRLQKLIEDDWLTSFHGMVNVERLCAPVQCIATIALGNHSPEAFRFLEKRVQAMPEALEAYTVSGSCDFIVRFACAHMTRYMTLTNSLIQECPEVETISTHVIMKQSKRFSRYPLDELMDTRI